MLIIFRDVSIDIRRYLRCLLYVKEILLLMYMLLDAFYCGVVRSNNTDFTRVFMNFAQYFLRFRHFFRATRILTNS